MSTPALLVIHPPTSARHSLVETATRAGFAVQACDGGIDGLSAFRQRPPDVLVASLDIDDMEGLALVSCVRDEAPDLSMVLVTARASVESAAGMGGRALLRCSSRRSDAWARASSRRVIVTSSSHDSGTSSTLRRNQVYCALPMPDGPVRFGVSSRTHCAKACVAVRASSMAASRSREPAA